MPTTHMPFFIGDYLKNTQHLSTEEHGAYMLMIMAYWMTGPIKNDKKTLKNITKISSKKLQNVLAFFDENNGYLVHETIERNKKKAIEYQEKKSDHGRAAANARWGKTGNAPAMPEHNQPKPYPDISTDVDICSDDNARAKADDLFVEISKEIQDLMKGRIFNTQIVRAWITAGGDKSLIIETIKVLMAKRNGEPPQSLKYFDRAIAEAIADRNRPQPKGESSYDNTRPRNGTRVPRNSGKHGNFAEQDYRKGTEGFVVS